MKTRASLVGLVSLALIGCSLGSDSTPPSEGDSQSARMPLVGGSNDIASPERDVTVAVNGGSGMMLTPLLESPPVTSSMMAYTVPTSAWG